MRGLGSRFAACCRDERGAITALIALSMPVLALIAALVVDIGNWKVKDRNLQTRADAGALAAGVEYVQQLRACIDPNTQGAVGSAITDVAKRYAGDTTASNPQNQGTNEQTRVWVGVNTTTYSGTDWDDGGSPCADHDPDDVSPTGGLWTDVKLTESSIPSFFGTLGFPLSQVNARARVEMKQIVGIAERGLPFVAETGDSVECVWAEFVGAASGLPDDGFSVSVNSVETNPVPLTGPQYSWDESNVTLTKTNTDAKDIAVRYWLGSRDGNAPCDFATVNKSPLPQDFDGGQPTDPILPISIDWINVWDNGANPGPDEAPKLRRFALTASTCGGPGFLYTNSTSTTSCIVNWVADVQTSSTGAGGTISVRLANDPDDDGTTPAPTVAPSPAAWSGTGLHTLTGSITINPNAVDPTTTFAEDYTQVGQIFLAVDWEQTSGTINGRTCTATPPPPNPAACQGTFPGETLDDQWGSTLTDVQHMTYMADPLASTPLVAAELSLENSLRGQLDESATFDIQLTHTALDQEHLVVFHDSVQASGNRTKSIWCGNGNEGAQALEDAVANGCAKQLVTNVRDDVCGPPELTLDDDPWDCVKFEQGNTTGPLAQGFETRFQCTTNGWAAARQAGTYPPEGDQRWAYIVLTGYGRTYAAPNNGWVPIEGLLRVYVTGWDIQGGGPVRPEDCGGDNDDPPRGYDSRGAQIWGHIVEPIVIGPDVITGDASCDPLLQILQCKPVLVR
jgi:hypothetical protein